MAKQDTKNKKSKGDDEKIIISDSSTIEAAEEKKPDHSVINQPAPKRGQSLLKSWKPANR